MGDANYSPVTIKPHGTMSIGFVDQNTAKFKETLDWLKFKTRFLYITVKFHHIRRGRMLICVVFQDFAYLPEPAASLKISRTKKIIY